MDSLVGMGMTVGHFAAAPAALPSNMHPFPAVVLNRALRMLRTLPNIVQQVLRTWAFAEGESQWNALQPRPGKRNRSHRRPAGAFRIHGDQASSINQILHDFPAGAKTTLMPACVISSPRSARSGHCSYLMYTLPAGEFDERVFQGLDFVVAEARKRQLLLILTLVNYWGDYGGILQAKRSGFDLTHQLSVALAPAEVARQPWCQPGWPTSSAPSLLANIARE